MGSLRDYVTHRDARIAVAARPRAWDSPAGRLKKLLVRSPKTRYRIRAALTLARAPREVRKARRLAASRSDLRLHLGCHLDHKAGFLNVDLAGIPVDLAWDIRRPLPFPDGSVTAIFHEHTLEHLDLADGIALTQECWRVLRPGGILRASVPDAGVALADYAAGEGTPTPLLRVQELFYEHGHRAMYDAETLTMLLRECGFTEVRVCARGQSRIDPCPDGERPHSLFVEGIHENRV